MSSVEQRNPTRPEDDSSPFDEQNSTTSQSTPRNSATSSTTNYGQATDSSLKVELPVDFFDSANPINSRTTLLNQNKQKAQRNSRIFYAIRLLNDAVLMGLAFATAYAIRYILQIGSEVLDEYQVGLDKYFPILFTFIVILSFTLHFKGYYRQNRVNTLLDEIGTIFSSTLIAVASIMVVIFISRPETLSRLMFVFLVPVTVILMGLERGVIRRVRRAFWKRGIGVQNLLVIGATDSAARFMKAVVDTPDLGYQLKGFVDNTLRFSEWTLPVRYHDGEIVPQLGGLENLSEVLNQYSIDEIIIALPSSHHLVINQIMNLCREAGVDFSIIPDLFEIRLDSLSLKEINGVPLIGVKGNNLLGWNYVIKRTMDIVMALVALIILSPLMLITALCIKLDSPGPVIFKQTRVGKQGKTFTFFKFRSMKTNADQLMKELLQYNETGGPTFKISQDPRRTRVGKFIRRTSLDELPQLFNILSGHMSFVGPRPPIDREVEQYDDWHHRRLEVTPGLTGLWQVSGRSKLSFDDMVKLDIYYAENWSLWLDIKILIRTIPAVLKGEGAF